MRSEQEPRFLTREEVDALHYEAIERYGGHHGVLNQHLVESAINQPQQTYHVGGGDLYEIAAAYAYHIVADHPYWDGNKRTGGAAAMTFLERNGVETSRLPEQQTYESLIKIADHQMDRFELAGYFRSTLSLERGAQIERETVVSDRIQAEPRTDPPRERVEQFEFDARKYTEDREYRARYDEQQRQRREQEASKRQRDERGP
jgi:death-on-curing protein